MTTDLPDYVLEAVRKTLQDPKYDQIFYEASCVLAKQLNATTCLTSLEDYKGTLCALAEETDKEGHTRPTYLEIEVDRERIYPKQTRCGEREGLTIVSRDEIEHIDQIDEHHPPTPYTKEERTPLLERAIRALAPDVDTRIRVRACKILILEDLHDAIIYMHVFDPKVE